MCLSHFPDTLTRVSVYAVLSAYLIACSLFLSIRAFQFALGVDGSIGDKLANLFSRTNGVLVAAIMSTVGELTFAFPWWHVLL